MLIYSNRLQHMVGMDERGLIEFAHWVIENPSANDVSVKKNADKIRGQLMPSVRDHILSKVTPPQSFAAIGENYSGDADDDSTKQSRSFKP